MALYLLRQVRQEIYQNTSALTRQIQELREHQAELFRFTISAVNQFAYMHNNPDEKANGDIATYLLDVNRKMREREERGLSTE